MLSELSPRSSFERFFAGGVQVSDRVLDALLCVDITGRAFVAVEGDRVVAHAMWATPRRNPGRAEIAVVVAADRRQRGLATHLTRLALADATGRGFVQFEATVLAENPAGQRVVRAILPNAISTRSHGEITFAATIDPSDATGRAPRARILLRRCPAVPPRRGVRDHQHRLAAGSRRRWYRVPSVRLPAPRRHFAPSETEAWGELESGP
jgi:GNAT superfamily N-acetyltransferase